MPIARARKLGNLIIKVYTSQHKFYAIIKKILFHSESTSIPGDSEGALRASKSDTSLTDSFVMVTEADTKPRKINPQNILRDGFKWQRQLVFRSKLTMHTAYDRKDNAEPASITALAVSRYLQRVHNNIEINRSFYNKHFHYILMYCFIKYTQIQKHFMKFEIKISINL